MAAHRHYPEFRISLLLTVVGHWAADQAIGRLDRRRGSRNSAEEQLGRGLFVSDSITRMLRAVKSGDQSALAPLWER